ncbi:hypothetical protein H4R21_000594, partial [Coemansia helicoidea]
RAGAQRKDRVRAVQRGSAAAQHVGDPVRELICDILPGCVVRGGAAVPAAVQAHRVHGHAQDREHRAGSRDAAAARGPPQAADKVFGPGVDRARLVVPARAAASHCGARRDGARLLQGVQQLGQASRRRRHVQRYPRPGGAVLQQDPMLLPREPTTRSQGRHRHARVFLHRPGVCQRPAHGRYRNYNSLIHILQVIWPL